MFTLFEEPDALLGPWYSPDILPVPTVYTFNILARSVLLNTILPILLSCSVWFPFNSILTTLNTFWIIPSLLLETAKIPESLYWFSAKGWIAFIFCP